ncbi:hypothetical protein GCM10011514_36730 [Emticicia aquatilis]|uniref:DUF1761 domain-containing protein n=1 Tax=Emticicia aquatilis TaxID=1537369 RepID=A0A916YZW8_9BACT|nr:DUF1761 domain-containing protein [Emticicia aquatilis]GGD69269.1 hypothetical protein GCM10011514_36730 [Emticicia aquatilis]
MEIQINYLAILIAVIAHFFLGFLWYTPLFGDAWAKEMKMDRNQKPDPKVMMKGMAFMLIGNFFTAYTLAHNIQAWNHVAGVAEMSAFARILNSGIFTWLGFYVPYHLGAIVWENRSWKLFFINVGYALVSLLLVSAILIYM